VWASNVYYDCAYLPKLGIQVDDSLCDVFQKIENYITTSPINIIAGAGISVSNIGTDWTITNTSPNINQTLSQVGNVISLSNGGGTVTIPAQVPQVLSQVGNVISLSGGGGTVTITQIYQTLSFDTNTNILSISNGNSVTLNSGSTPTVYTAGTGISIVGNVITNTAPNTNQTISIAGNVVSLSSGGGSVTLPTTAPQTLSIAGNNLSISGGNTVVLPTPAAIIEIQANNFNFSETVTQSYNGFHTGGGLSTGDIEELSNSTEIIDNYPEGHVFLVNTTVNTINLPTISSATDGRILEFKFAKRSGYITFNSTGTRTLKNFGTTISSYYLLTDTEKYLKVKPHSSHLYWEVVDSHLISI